MATLPKDSQSISHPSRFTDLLVEFLEAREELLFELRKTPLSSRQVSDANERLSQARLNLNGLFVEWRD